MYHKKAAHYYDFFASKEDLPFFRRLLLRLGGPVLDFGCGTGVLALDLAGAGLEVLGVDNSPYMLDIALDRLGQAPPSVRDRIEFIEGDMIDFPREDKFVTVLIARGSFGHLLSTDDQLRCLTNAGNLLADGGKIVLDLYPPSLDFLRGGTSVGKSVTLDNETSLLRTIHTRCDLNTQRCRNTIIYEQFKGGIMQERVLEEFSTCLLFPREAMLLLALSGYTVEEVYGDTSGGSYSASSRRMIVIAGKKC